MLAIKITGWFTGMSFVLDGRFTSRVEGEKAIARIKHMSTLSRNKLEIVSVP